MHVKTIPRLYGWGSGAVAHGGKWLCRPTHRATPEDQLYASTVGTPDELSPIAPAEARNGAQGR